MPSPEEVIRLEEQELATQEQGVGQMEEQLEAQEAGLLQMEKSFAKRNKTLRNLQEYVANQETSLLTRAEAIGPKAKALVEQTLATARNEASSEEAFSMGAVDERQVLLERRREMLAMRMELVEEREQLYSKRLEAVDGADSHFSTAEEKLLSREKVIADTLRKLITQASELSGGDEDDDDEEPALGARAGPTAEPEAPAAAKQDPAPAQEARPTAPARPVTAPMPAAPAPRKKKSRLPTGPLGSRAVAVMERKIDERDGVTVEHGRVDKQSATSTPSGARTRSESSVTRQRRGRGRSGAKQFKITLEAVLGQGEKHTFFRYRADGPTDLPGLFLATPNLLREGREVKLRIKINNNSIETRGVVSWRRQATDGQGPPGMGIEIAELSEEDWGHVGAYMKKAAPMVV